MKPEEAARRISEARARLASAARMFREIEEETTRLIEHLRGACEHRYDDARVEVSQLGSAAFCRHCGGEIIPGAAPSADWLEQQAAVNP